MSNQFNDMTNIAEGFKNKVVLVVGGSSGIGRSAARRFAGAGARVVIAARREREGREVVAEIHNEGQEAAFIGTDVEKSNEVERAVSFAVDHFGDLHAAFNNAGIEGKFAPIVECTPEEFDRTIAVNLRGVWLAIKYELEAFRKLGHGGAIVNTSSWLAQGALAGSSIYSASKAALDGLIRAVALEAAPLGIRINNVNPGTIDTPMFRRFGAPEEIGAPFVAHTPLGRLGAPEDVADAVQWLSCDAARFVTGQSILVDGGFAIPGPRWS